MNAIAGVLRRPVVSGVVIAGVLHVGGIFANLGWNALLARSLSDSQYGLFALLANQSLLLATVIGAGLPLAVIHFYPRHVAAEQRGEARKVAVAFWRRSLMSGVLAGATGAAAFSLSGCVFSLPADPVAWILASLLTGLLCVANYQLELARSVGSMTLSYLPMRIGWPLSGSAVVAVLVWWGGQPGASVALAVFVGCGGVFTAAQAVTLLKRIESPEQGFTARSGPTASTWDEWRRVAQPLWGMGVGAMLLATADVVALGYCLSEADAGHFFAAKRFAALAVICQFAVNARVAPLISAAMGEHGDYRDRLQPLLSRSAGVCFLGACPLVGLLILFGDRVLALFGSAYADAAGVLCWLACGQLVNAAGGAAGSLMNVSGMQRQNAIVVLATAGGQVLGCLVLAPWLGMLGGGVAMLVAALVRNLVIARLARRGLGVDPTVLALVSKPLA